MNDLQKFLCGGISGSIGAFCVFPIDLVKTRMQNQINSHNKLYKSSFNCFTSIIKNDGILGLYKGSRINICGVFPEKAVKLTVNDFILNKNKDDNGNVELKYQMLAGACAGFCQVIVTNPIEIIKIQLQMSSLTSKNNNVLGVINTLGFKNLYKGSLACLSRDTPFSLIYFPLYENLKSRINTRHKTINYLIPGCLAGFVSAFTTTPCDVIKTRIQTIRNDSVKYSGIVDCYKKVYKNEGINAFFKGAIVRSLRSSFQFGITLLFYETLVN